MEELKRCPFCGGEAEICVDSNYLKYTMNGLPHNETVFVIFCVKCGAKTRHLKPEKAAIAAWNRRVEG